MKSRGKRPGPLTPLHLAPMLLAPVLLALVLCVSSASAQEFELGADERRQLGEPLGVALTGAALETRAHEVGSLLRCPVCQGLSVFDSPVPAARAMQAKVQLLLEAGYSEGQILNYFETSYGEFVRLSPKPEGFNLVVWILPVLATLLGLGLVAVRVKRAPVEVDATLEAYRERVRKEVAE